MAERALTAAEWELIESTEHDRVYRDNHPFFFTTDRIDVAKVLEWEDYCYKPGRRPDRGHRTRKLFELIGVPNLAGKRVLDMGSGNGQYAVLFAMMGAEVEACDISPVGVECGRRFAVANGVADRCHFSVQNAAATTFADASFDIVVMHEVLHHAIKYPGVREETLRILRTGGQLVCAETLRGNALLDFGRKFSMRGEEAKGDVILVPQDLERFAEGFSSYRLEPMSLFFMGRRVLQGQVHLAPVRWFLRATKAVDDVLLWLAPGLKRYCGECVAVLVK